MQALDCLLYPVRVRCKGEPLLNLTGQLAAARRRETEPDRTPCDLISSTGVYLQCDASDADNWRARALGAANKAGSEFEAA
jgi:hypothetical protein